MSRSDRSCAPYLAVHASNCASDRAFAARATAASEARVGPAYLTSCALVAAAVAASSAASGAAAALERSCRIWRAACT